MKLKYVSVLREPGTNSRDDLYLVKGELEGQPPKLWVMQFQIIWASTPTYSEICQSPKFNRNEILIQIKDSRNICPAIDALKAITAKLKGEGGSRLKISEEIILQYFHALF
jgi:hypothetical protein